MKVHNAIANVTSVGAGAEHTARIKESPKAFHILSGALYSDKILAVVRELSTNAYDAHVQAGRTDVPFEVHIPSYTDQTFFVKDYGPGLSEDQIYNLYMVYFESTKQDSDDYVGQLGLGCKSPFSYGSTFTVESRQDGIKKVYTCYKNSELLPAVTKMAEAPTDEPDGLTVSLSVRNEDLNRFRDAARYALMYFDVAPKVTGWGGVEPYEVKYVLESTNWKMRTQESIYTGPRVIQGYVSYPIDMKLVQETLGIAGDKQAQTRWSELANLWGDSNIDLFVPIGQVEIAPSREALTYDRRTALNLVRVFEEAVVELKDVTRADIGQADTLWETLCMIYDKANRSSASVGRVIRKMLTDGEFLFNGERVYQQITVGIDEDSLSDDNELTPAGIRKCNVNNTRVLGASRTWHRGAHRVAFTSTGWPSAGRPHLMVGQGIAKTLVVIDDVWTHRRLTSKAINEHMNNYGYMYVLFITSMKDDEPATDQAEVEAIIEALGNPEVMMVSELERPKPTQRSAYVKKEKNQLPVWQSSSRGSGSSTEWSPKMWETQEIELTDGGVYIEVERYTPNGVNSSYRLDRLITFAKHFGLIDQDAEVVGIPARRVEYVLKQGDWKNLLDIIHTSLKDADVATTVVEDHTAYMVRQAISSQPDMYNVFTHWAKIKLEVTRQEFIDVMDELVEYYKVDAFMDARHLLGANVNLLDAAKYTQQEDIIATWAATIGAGRPAFANLNMAYAVTNEQGIKMIAAAINGTL